MNNVKTMVLMAGLMGLFLLAGQLLGGSQGLVLALIVGSAFNFIMYFFSDKMVLRMYGAQVVTEEQAPELYRMVDRLRQRAGLPMPVVAVAPHEQPNAFATGRNPEHAVVGGDDRHPEVRAAGGARGRDRARAGAREEPRHAHHHDRGGHRGRDQQPALPAHVRRRARRRRRRTRWRSSRSSCSRRSARC